MLAGSRPMDIEVALTALEAEIEPLERFLRIFAASLNTPHMRRGDGDTRFFRYDHPDVRHFCLLKSVVTVSALNASFALARKGYIQEINVLMRTVVECSAHIEFVIEPFNSDDHRAAADGYVKDYFADSKRSPVAEITKAHIKRGNVHTALGETLDDFAQRRGDTKGRIPAVVLNSNSYRIFSNFVHARYPEAIDLFGGRPGEFQLRGMSGTAKDTENLATLQAFLETAATTGIRMIQGLNLRTLVEGDPIVARWYEEKLSNADPMRATGN
jgi:hypothetical protein